MDATSMIQQFTSGTKTIQDVVKASISKLEEIQPQLNAATEILSADATKQLKQLPDGSLKGLPISVKECYAMAGKQIRSGSKRMKPIQCAEDAAVVKKLKDAGALIVARGNTSEFLLGRETDNLIYGTTNNAINPELTAGGSSGGDGSLVGSGSVAFGIGTDIGGSCRYPALFNGIVGFKPASGQIDKTGIFPSAGNEFVETMNSPGILCRSVRDARIVYNVIGNKQLHESNDLGDIQIYISTNFRVKINDSSIQQALDASIDFFKSKSVAVKDIEIPESGEHYKDFVTFITAGFTDTIYEWSVTERGEKLSFLGELFRRLTGKPTLSAELFAMLIPFNIFKPSPAKLEKLIRKTELLRDQYYALLGKNGVLILPTVGILAPKHKKFIPQYNKPGVIEIITPVSFCNVYNLSCITLPAWKFQNDKQKNPPAVQLVAAPGSEALLLNIAEQLEICLKK
jgi:Asp-tRNA(Asn)/Glu-tRNA(Gln) amidotransferase A subunit family amidase